MLKSQKTQKFTRKTSPFALSRLKKLRYHNQFGALAISQDGKKELRI